MLAEISRGCFAARRCAAGATGMRIRIVAQQAAADFSYQIWLQRKCGEINARRR